MVNNNNGKVDIVGRELCCVVLVGLFGSGKISLLEVIFVCMDSIDCQGNVSDGNMVGDGLVEVCVYGMSVEFNFVEMIYFGDWFSFIDCFGLVEFFGEMDMVFVGVDLVVVVVEDDECKVFVLQLFLKVLEVCFILWVLFLNKIDKSSCWVWEVLDFL